MPLQKKRWRNIKIRGVSYTAQFDEALKTPRLAPFGLTCFARTNCELVAFIQNGFAFESLSTTHAASVQRERFQPIMCEAHQAEGHRARRFQRLDNAESNAMRHKFEEGASVYLQEDYSATGLYAGSVGKVWAFYMTEPPAYEVTFQLANGDEIDMTVEEDEITAVPLSGKVLETAQAK